MLRKKIWDIIQYEGVGYNISYFVTQRSCGTNLKRAYNRKQLSTYSYCMLQSAGRRRFFFRDFNRKKSINRQPLLY